MAKSKTKTETKLATQLDAVILLLTDLKNRDQSKTVEIDELIKSISK